MTVLIIVDVQNEFLSPKPIFDQEWDSRNVIDNGFIEIAPTVMHLLIDSTPF